MRRRTFLKMAPALGALASCNKQSKIRLALNWKPEPEFGGFYAADFARHGLDVEILPGGIGTPTVQMIGAGSAEFGVVSGEEIVLARARGADVVGLFAVYQDNPAGIMTHASRNMQSLADVVRGGTLGLQLGLPWVDLLKKKYGLDHVKIVPSPGGDLTMFLHDENFSQQCFIDSEPLAARRKGVAVKVFPVSDLGYNPYSEVLTTAGDTLRQRPETVKTMVDAVREGWRAYLDNPKPANERMQRLNPSMDAVTFAEVAAAGKPMIETDPLGKMTKDRWEQICRTLLGAGVISKAPAAEDCFRSV